MVALRLQPSAACVKNCPVVTLFGSFQYFLRFELCCAGGAKFCFYLAMEAGMDAAIVSASKILLCRGLRKVTRSLPSADFDQRRFEGDVCVSLAELTTLFEGRQQNAIAAKMKVYPRRTS